MIAMRSAAAVLLMLLGLAPTVASWILGDKTGAAVSKVTGIARDIPPLDVYGPENGDLLILGWGSTYGVIRSAVERLRAEAPGLVLRSALAAPTLGPPEPHRMQLA